MTFWTVIGRAFRFRCPVCGKGAVFKGLVAVHPSCSECRHPFQPETGYYVGAMYLNYLVTAILGMTAALLLLPHVELAPLVTGSIVYAIVFPLIFHRTARSLWLAVDTYVCAKTSPPDPGGDTVTAPQDRETSP